MQPFRLTALQQSNDSPPSIRVYSRSSMIKLATLWGDGTVAFNSDIDYEKEEVKAILELQEHFFTIWNAIIEKDEEIRELKLSLNPVIQRQ